MLFNKAVPTRIEQSFDVHGPSSRGALTTTDPKYAAALFSEVTRTTGVGTAAPSIIDLAKFADGNTHTEWLRGGTYVRVLFPMPARFAVRLENSSSTSVALTTTTGRAVAANEAVEFVVDEDFRYLEVLALDTSASYVEHYKKTIANKALSLSDA